MLKLIVTLGAGACLAATTLADAKYIDFNKNGKMDPYEDASLPRATRVRDLISRMTLGEKAAQLSQMQLVTTSAKKEGWGETTYAPRREAVRKGLGSMIFFDADVKGRNEWQKIAVEETRLGIPMIFGMDIIHGDKLVFPISLGLACAFEPQLFERAQTIAARESSAAGIDWVFAPMCDLARDPRWGRVSETCGEDPYLAGLCCAAQVRGFQGPDPAAPDRVAACLKHYVAYSAVTGGRDYNDSEVTRWTLWNMHLPSFRAGVEAGAFTVMSSFNTIEGVPAVANRYTLTDVLRGVLGFDGFVVSDWNAVEELTKWGVAADKTEAAELALNAGNDMDMLSDCYQTGFAANVASGKIDMRTIDEALRRVLDVKMRIGLFEHPYKDESLQAKVQLDVDQHARDLALTCAERSTVLLKNNGILPLDAKALKRVALIGPVADDRRELNGCWCYRGNDQRLTIAEALKSALKGVQIDVVKGCAVNCEPPTKIGQDGVVVADRSAKPADASLDLKGAVAAAKEADVVVMTLAETYQWTGENASRASLGLTGRQQELFDAVAAVGKPIVAVIYSGRPLALPEVWEKSSAVFYAWQPGSEGPRAIANLLTGVAQPQGRLSMSVPHDVSQVPAFYNKAVTGRPDGDWCGQYRDTKERGSRYPFGYGLTYTTFKYGPVAIKDGVARCTITNTGARKGVEVAQLYVRQVACRAGWRPACELRGFERVTLEPGASKEVSFRLDPATLGYVTREGQRVCDRGAYKIWIAPNARDRGTPADLLHDSCGTK